MTTGFFWDEKCFWHAGGNYAFTLPIGGFVQPLNGAGLPETQEAKRRLKNLMDVRRPEPATIPADTCICVSLSSFKGVDG